MSKDEQKMNYSIAYLDVDGEERLIGVQYLADLFEEIKRLLGRKEIIQLKIGKLSG